MATTAFADPPDDRNDFDCSLVFDDDPPSGLAVHTSEYHDDDCIVRFTFVAPFDLVSFRRPLIHLTDLN